MPYVPHTETDIQEMLETIGVNSISQLFDEIPENLHSEGLTQVPEGRGEMAVSRLMAERATQGSGLNCFLGAGAYEHHIPAAVWDLAARGEFMTAYTPYQAEASQGTLQIIYEYQSMMAHLCAMDVSNASLYDGASALAEAVLMSVRANRKSKSRRVLIPKTVNPAYRSVCHSIVDMQNINIEELDFNNASGCFDLNNLKAFEGEDIAALVVSFPNFFGNLEDVHALSDWAKNNGTLLIAVCNPIALSVLTPPGEWGEQGADIVVGEGQPLGIPLASGGPYFGFMCCKQQIVRQMPGRIIGRTVDLDGKEGFALTLQAREQHIRRSKATSNICTNQGWAVCAATMYMSLMGAEGLEQVASCSHHTLEILKAGLQKLPGVELVYNTDQFHELVFRTAKPAQGVLKAMLQHGLLAGLSLQEHYPELSNCILVCTTETKNDADIENYLSTLQKVLGGEG
jgi:glycine dehydrogenase subunit 1